MQQVCCLCCRFSPEFVFFFRTKSWKVPIQLPLPVWNATCEVGRGNSRRRRPKNNRWLAVWEVLSRGHCSETKWTLSLPFYCCDIFLLLSPFCLRCGMCCVTGVYSVEKFTDCSWLCISLGLIFVYHFVILQGLGLVRTLVTILQRLFILNKIYFRQAVAPCSGSLQFDFVKDWTTRMQPVLLKVTLLIAQDLATAYGLPWLQPASQPTDRCRIVGLHAG